MNGRVGGGLRNCRLLKQAMGLGMEEDTSEKGVRWEIVCMVGLIVAAEVFKVDWAMSKGRLERWLTGPLIGVSLICIAISCAHAYIHTLLYCRHHLKHLNPLPHRHPP